MDRAAASAFYQVVNLRYEKEHSTIVTTNRCLPDWGEILATPSSTPPSWTGSCTTPSYSTSRARPATTDPDRSRH
jgi:hypothetical protein